MKHAVAVFVPRQEGAHPLRYLLRRQQAACLINDALPHQYRRQIDQPGAAQPRGLAAADDVHFEFSIIAHAAHSAVHTHHAAGHARALKGGAAGHGAAGEAVPAAQRHFTVGADVQIQEPPGSVRKAGGQQPGGDVAAHIARCAGEIVYWRAQQGILYRLAEQRLRLKGRGGQRLHGYTGEQQLHHRVPGQHNSLQLPRFAVRLRQRLRQQRLYLRPNAARQRGQAVRLLPGVLDAGDHIRAVGRLCVPAGAGGCHPPCGQIVQPHRHGGGAQIHGGGAAALAGGCSRRIQRLREDAPARRRGRITSSPSSGTTRQASRGTPLTLTRHLPQRPCPPQAAGSVHPARRSSASRVSVSLQGMRNTSPPRITRILDTGTAPFYNDHTTTLISTALLCQEAL